MKNVLSKQFKKKLLFGGNLFILMAKVKNKVKGYCSNGKNNNSIDKS